MKDLASNNVELSRKRREVYKIRSRLIISIILLLVVIAAVMVIVLS